MDFTYLITIAAFLVCFLAVLIGLRLIVSGQTSSAPVSGNKWYGDSFLPVLLTTVTAFILLFAFSGPAYDQIYPLNWTDMLPSLISMTGIYFVSLFAKTSRLTFPVLIAGIILCTAFLPADFTLFQNNLLNTGFRLLLNILDL